MFAVFYRWHVPAGREDQFVEAWRELTLAMRQACGSFGSRLHRGDDGSWIAYARWPDAATRERCDHGRGDAVQAMRAVAELIAEWQTDIVLDLLEEPVGR